MDEQVLFDQFHAAYEFEPRAGSFERLQSTLVRSRIQLQPQRRFGLGRLSPRTVRLLAAAALIAVVVAAAGAFIAVQQYSRGPIPVVPPPPTGECAINQLLPNDLLVCSADDFAVLGQSAVFITHDAGLTWLSVKAPCCLSDSPGVRWIDSADLVLVYGSDLIQVTTDGGIHWQTIKSGWREGPNLPFMLDAHEGWMYGANGLFHTTDGGAHWAAVSTFPSFKCCDFWADPIFFVNSQEGFLRQIGQLSITQDGGRTWSRATVSPAPPDSQFGNVLQGPFMFGKGGLMAFLAGGDGLGNGTTLSVYKTADGGLTWSGPRTAPGVWLSALDMKTWWVLDVAGRLSRTSDGGNSWQRVPTNLAKGMALTSVTPVGGGVLWGIATNGYFAKTLPGGGVKNYPNLVTVRSTDGGIHWSVVKLPA